jgi:hypothetical protein
MWVLGTERMHLLGQEVVTKKKAGLSTKALNELLYGSECVSAYER